MMVFNFFNNISTLFNDTHLLLIIKSVSIIYQLFLIGQVFYYYRSNKTTRKYTSLAALFIFTIMTINLYWVLKLGDKLDLFKISLYFEIPFMRVCWILLIFNKIVLVYIISHFAYKRLYNLEKITAAIGVLLSTTFLYFTISLLHERSTYEWLIFKLTYLYILLIYLRIVYLTFKGIYRNNKLPKIKKEQLKFLLFYIFIPQFLSDLLTVNPFAFSITYKIQNYGFKSITTLLFTYAMHYCAQNLFKLRFLNIANQVGSTNDNTFTTDFKPVLEQVSSVSTADELRRIVKQFISNNYTIPEDTISLYIRENNDNNSPTDTTYDYVEQLLQKFVFHDQAVMKTLHDQKIIIQDEVAFSQEYNPTHSQSILLYICQKLEIVAFVPIFQYDRLVGYITVDENARDELFTQREQDELLMFAHYLSNVIYLLSHRDIRNVIAREKTLQADLYQRERELEQYKESMRSCFRSSQDKEIVVILYKSRRFNFRNKAAKDMIGIDPNTEKGHPLANTLKDIVNKVETQQQLKTVTTYNRHKRKIIISAVPELDANGIIITAHYPEVTETIHDQVNNLHNPNDWNYLLYLEATNVGQHLEQLLPGKSEQLLNIKISLLQAALSKQPVLLSGAREDTLEFISFLHKASDRDVFHTITLDTPEHNGHIMQTIFGSATSGTLSDPTMLEQLHENGTLFLENVHFLSFQTQKHISQYLHYGYFQKENSEYKLVSDARIIGASTYPVETLLEQGMMLPSFHKEFPYIISLPKLDMMSQSDFHVLVDALAGQIITNNAAYRLLAFTQQDYSYLQYHASDSLHELRQEITRLLRKKSEKHNLDQSHDAIHIPKEPTLFRAAQLGKEALKDRELMIFLWNTFKSQSKIATLLNVNRSSVNRRCKQYNLLDYGHKDVHENEETVSAAS